MTELLAKSGINADASISVDIPTKAIVHVVSCLDPMAYTGRILTAQTLVEELGL